jgi:hypothetical protein
METQVQQSFVQSCEQAARVVEGFSDDALDASFSVYSATMALCARSTSAIVRKTHSPMCFRQRRAPRRH